MIALVGKIAVNSVYAKVQVTLARPGQLLMLGLLQLRAKKESKLQVFRIVEFSENTNIFPGLTHLEPEVRFTDGQIPPEILTGPCSSTP